MLFIIVSFLYAMFLTKLLLKSLPIDSRLKEQIGFIQGRSPVDNIITIQETMHTLNQDYSFSPRMIVKINIEKPYDTFSWKVILATLVKMNFPTIWLAWIQSYISTPTCAFLINGQPRKFIKTSIGVYQGDPLSSYFFILVSQNLTVFLNHSLALDMILGFDTRLSHNFNHLMYVGDLVLITKASRSVARNVKLCLSIYSDLTGQNPNRNKSTIFFPK